MSIAVMEQISFVFKSQIDSFSLPKFVFEGFEIEADDLELQCVLGRGAYGVVEKVKHKSTGTVLAVKVRFLTGGYRSHGLRNMSSQMLFQTSAVDIFIAHEADFYTL